MELRINHVEINCSRPVVIQWGTQDFPEGGTNLLFGKILAKKCIKLKGIVPIGSNVPNYPHSPWIRKCNYLLF